MQHVCVAMQHLTVNWLQTDADDVWKMFHSWPLFHTSHTVLVNISIQCWNVAGTIVAGGCCCCCCCCCWWWCWCVFARLFSVLCHAFFDFIFVVFGVWFCNVFFVLFLFFFVFLVLWLVFFFVFCFFCFLCFLFCDLFFWFVFCLFFPVLFIFFAFLSYCLDSFHILILHTAVVFVGEFLHLWPVTRQGAPHLNFKRNFKDIHKDSWSKALTKAWKSSSNLIVVIKYMHIKINLCNIKKYINKYFKRHIFPIHIYSAFYWPLFRWHQLDTRSFIPTSCTIKETQEGHMEHWQSTLARCHCWPWRNGVKDKLLPTLLGTAWGVCSKMPGLMSFLGSKHLDPDPQKFFSKKDPTKDVFSHDMTKRVFFKTALLLPPLTTELHFGQNLSQFCIFCLVRRVVIDVQGIRNNWTIVEPIGSIYIFQMVFDAHCIFTRPWSLSKVGVMAFIWCQSQRN